MQDDGCKCSAAYGAQDDEYQMHIYFLKCCASVTVGIMCRSGR